MAKKNKENRRNRHGELDKTGPSKCPGRSGQVMIGEHYLKIPPICRMVFAPKSSEMRELPGRESRMAEPAAGFAFPLGLRTLRAGKLAAMLAMVFSIACSDSTKITDDSSGGPTPKNPTPNEAGLLKVGASCKTGKACQSGYCKRSPDKDANICCAEDCAGQCNGDGRGCQCSDRKKLDLICRNNGQKLDDDLCVCKEIESKYVQIELGDRFGCVVEKKGASYCWGTGSYGVGMPLIRKIVIAKMKADPGKSMLEILKLDKPAMSYREDPILIPRPILRLNKEGSDGEIALFSQVVLHWEDEGCALPFWDESASHWLPPLPSCWGPTFQASPHKFGISGDTYKELCQPLSLDYAQLASIKKPTEINKGTIKKIQRSIWCDPDSPFSLMARPHSVDRNVVTKEPFPWRDYTVRYEEDQIGSRLGPESKQKVLWNIVDESRSGSSPALRTWPRQFIQLTTNKYFSVSFPEKYLWCVVPVVTKHNTEQASICWGDLKYQMIRTRFAGVDEMDAEMRTSALLGRDLKVGEHHVVTASPFYSSGITGPYVCTQKAFSATVGCGIFAYNHTFLKEDLDRALKGIAKGSVACWGEADPSAVYPAFYGRGTGRYMGESESELSDLSDEEKARAASWTRNRAYSMWQKSGKVLDPPGKSPTCENTVAALNPDPFVQQLTQHRFNRVRFEKKGARVDSTDDFLEASSIVSGEQHFCATKLPEMTAYCWGENTSGQVDPETAGLTLKRENQGKRIEAIPLAVPVKFLADEKLLQITAAFDFNCAIKKRDRRVACWGSNVVQQLGFGSKDRAGATGQQQASCQSKCFNIRVANGDTSDGRFRFISAGPKGVCGIAQDDDGIYCWGVAWDQPKAYKDAEKCNTACKQSMGSGGKQRGDCIRGPESWPAYYCVDRSPRKVPDPIWATTEAACQKACGSLSGPQGRTAQGTCIKASNEIYYCVPH